MEGIGGIETETKKDCLKDRKKWLLIHTHTETEIKKERGFGKAMTRYVCSRSSDPPSTRIFFSFFLMGAAREGGEGW